MMKVTLVIIFVVIVASGPASAQDRQYFCGRRLADAMSVLCEGLNSPSKRANSLDYNPAGGWIRATRAIEMSKRGIVDECCNNPCSLEDLLAYC